VFVRTFAPKRYSLWAAAPANMPQAIFMPVDWSSRAWMVRARTSSWPNACVASLMPESPAA